MKYNTMQCTVHAKRIRLSSRKKHNTTHTKRILAPFFRETLLCVQLWRVVALFFLTRRQERMVIIIVQFISLYREISSKSVMFSRSLLGAVRGSVFAARRGISSSEVRHSTDSLVRTNYGLQRLHDILEAQIPIKQAALKKLKEKYGNMSLGEVTVDQVCI
jgi:hypothetical protein